MSKSRFEFFIEGTCGGDCCFENCAYDWNGLCACGCEHEFREAKNICEQLDAYEAFYDQLYHSMTPEEYEQLPSEEDDRECEQNEKRLRELEEFIVQCSQDVDDYRPVAYHSYDCAGFGGLWPSYIRG